MPVYPSPPPRCGRRPPASAPIPIPKYFNPRRPRGGATQAARARTAVATNANGISNAYDSQRNTDFLGLCLYDRRLGGPLHAREHCQRALTYDSSDPIAYFELGDIYSDLFQLRGR